MLQISNWIISIVKILARYILEALYLIILHKIKWTIKIMAAITKPHGVLKSKTLLAVLIVQIRL
jgi:hypothetical protein